MYENVYKLQKKFLVRVFLLKYIFRIKFKILILDLMFLPKNSVPFEGLYSSSRWIRAYTLNCSKYGSVLYLLNQWIYFDQACIDTL